MNIGKAIIELKELQAKTCLVREVVKKISEAMLDDVDRFEIKINHVANVYGRLWTITDRKTNFIFTFEVSEVWCKGQRAHFCSIPLLNEQEINVLFEVVQRCEKCQQNRASIKEIDKINELYKDE